MNVVLDLALVWAEVLDLPVRVQPLEDAAVACLARDLMRPFEGDSRYVDKADRREADLDLSIEAACLSVPGHCLWQHPALRYPWYEPLVCFDVMHHSEEVLPAKGQHLARLKRDWLTCTPEDASCDDLC